MVVSLSRLRIMIDQLDPKTLPVCKPSITTYLHHANSLCITETLPHARHFLINYFLQLYTCTGLEKKVDFFASDGMHPRYPFIHRAWLSTLTLKMIGGDIIEQICRMIDSGCYVDALLDEYYISEKLSFNQSHFPHQNLIYGYSLSNRCFLAQGFNKQARYGAFVIPFEEVRAGLRHDLGLCVVSRTDLLDHNNSSPFDANVIATYLGDFLESKNSFLSYRPKNEAFGVATYEYAVKLIEENNGERIDIRPWCVFSEHKDKLQNLYNYFAIDNSIVFQKDVVDELLALRNNFLDLRNYVLESALTGRIINIKTLRRNINVIAEKEVYVIRSLIDAAVKIGLSL
jgi:hypothetical protein